MFLSIGPTWASRLSMWHHAKVTQFLGRLLSSFLPIHGLMNMLLLWTKAFLAHQCASRTEQRATVWYWTLAKETNNKSLRAEFPVGVGNFWEQVGKKPSWWRSLCQEHRGQKPDDPAWIGPGSAVRSYGIRFTFKQLTKKFTMASVLALDILKRKGFMSAVVGIQRFGILKSATWRIDRK